MFDSSTRMSWADSRLSAFANRCSGSGESIIRVEKLRSRSRRSYLRQVGSNDDCGRPVIIQCSSDGSSVYSLLAVLNLDAVVAERLTQPISFLPVDGE